MLRDPAGPLRSRLSFLHSPTLRRATFWLLIIVSLCSIVFSPLDSTIERAKRVGPWVGIGLLVTELLFVLGLAVMAWSVGLRMGLNPLAWRTRIDTVLASLNRSPAFWVGLAVNTVGAVGTGFVMVAAIVVGLPLSAAGLLVLPIADLALTAAVRTAAVKGVRVNR